MKKYFMIAYTFLSIIILLGSYYLWGINNTFPEKQIAATVKIMSICEDKGNEWLAIGTGAIISQDGLIVTNAHNTSNAKKIIVFTQKGDVAIGTIIMENAKVDLTILKINIGKLDYFTVGNDQQPKIGDLVYAVGNPSDLDFTLTSGIISSLDRKIELIHHPKGIENFIQTDVPLNSGCSGGPLINQSGKLIGINTAIISQSGRYEGYSFAIPVSRVLKMLSDCKKTASVHVNLISNL